MSSPAHKDPWKDKDLVFLDVETTGLSPRAGDRVVEIAALRVRNFEVVDRFETLVDPEREISDRASMVNGITQSMLFGAPKADEILDDLYQFLSGSCLVAHNAEFDLGFLNNELVLGGCPTLEHFSSIDTVKMSRELLPDLGRYSLFTLAQYFGIEETRQHRAMPDVEMTVKVFKHLIKIASRKDIHDPEMMIQLFGESPRKEELTRTKILMIKEAIQSKAGLNLQYFGIKSGMTFRQVTPKGITGAGRRTALVGYCHLRNEERNFRLDRILNVERL